MRASSSGPRSETVARTGWPCSPNTSQNTTGTAGERGRRRRRSASGAPRAWATSRPAGSCPARSPLTSAMKTGTPIAEKRSAMHLQRDRLAGAGGAGDEAVAVGERGQQGELGVAVAGDRAGGRAWRFLGSGGRRPNLSLRGPERPAIRAPSRRRRPLRRAEPGIEPMPSAPRVDDERRCPRADFCYESRFGCDEKKWAGHSPFFFAHRTSKSCR